MPGASLLLFSLLGDEISQRQIVDNILHIFDPVFEAVATTAQTVVLEIEHLEAGVQILDKLVDQKRTLVVTKRDSIACKTCLSLLMKISTCQMGTYQFLDQGDERLQIFLERQMELVAVFQVHRTCILLIVWPR